MYVDKNIIDKIEDNGFKRFMSLILFAAINASKDCKFGNESHFMHELIGGIFSATSKARLSRALKFYQFLATETESARVILYFNPFGYCNSTPLGVCNESIGSDEYDKSFLMTYSINSPNANAKVMQEDFFELYSLLRGCNELMNVETELERIKLLNS